MNLAEFCPGLDINSFICSIYLFICSIYLFALVYFGIWDVIKVNRKTASRRSDKRVVTTGRVACVCAVDFN